MICENRCQSIHVNIFQVLDTERIEKVEECRIRGREHGDRGIGISQGTAFESCSQNGSNENGEFGRCDCSLNDVGWSTRHLGLTITGARAKDGSRDCVLNARVIHIASADQLTKVGIICERTARPLRTYGSIVLDVMHHNRTGYVTLLAQATSRS